MVTWKTLRNPHVLRPSRHTTQVHQHFRAFIFTIPIVAQNHRELI